jgi:hypothetical protein
VTPDVLAHALETLRQQHDIVGVGITEYVPDLSHDRSVLDRVLTALDINAPSAQPSPVGCR